MAIEQFAAAVAMVAQDLQRIRRQLSGGELLQLQQRHGQFHALHLGPVRAAVGESAPRTRAAPASALDETGVKQAAQGPLDGLGRGVRMTVARPQPGMQRL
ncbi:hypothetical protein B7P02_05850 [Bordetella bronchiseptica]|nr:hypothetical protein BTL45_05885 [Bordetella bronchiseptica]AWP57543.1 hypothetical protein B7P02_05850 [Bordetella bronchiseptica]RSB96838.1 hypothetical protein EGT31_01000 [Bordetella bronchiseptica]RSC05891.1 hypothetical protein EGT23_03850 [Bordetella bronchiseptica]